MTVMEFSIYPVGKEESLSPYVARCIRIVESSGLDYQCHAMGTVVEGELDQVMDLVRRCFAELATDCDRIECTVRLDFRKAARGRLRGKVASVEQKLGHEVPKGG